MSSDLIPRWGSNITSISPGPAESTSRSLPPSTTIDPIADNGPDPSLFIATRYTRYDASGRISGHGYMGLGILQQLRITEGRILVGIEGDHSTQWVDDEDGNPTLEDRPVLDIPTELITAAGVEAVIPSLPACRISFSGPLAGGHDHPGGEVLIGFAIPGRYTLTMEPFPYQRAELRLEVTA